MKWLQWKRPRRCAGQSRGDHDHHIGETVLKRLRRHVTPHEPLTNADPAAPQPRGHGVGLDPAAPCDGTQAYPALDGGGGSVAALGGRQALGSDGTPPVGMHRRPEQAGLIVAFGLTLAFFLSHAVGILHGPLLTRFAAEIVETAIIAVVFGALFVTRHARLLQERKTAEVLRRLSFTDGLTGLANRSAFTAAVAKELGRSRRYGHECVVLMWDLNGLKDVNDTQGHLAGDRMLRAFASVLERTVRETDVAARLGGDEFGVLLVNTGEVGAPRFIERVEGLIRQLPAEQAITAAVGVSVYPADGSSFDELMAKADSRMYGHKHQLKAAQAISQHGPRPARRAATVPVGGNNPVPASGGGVVS